MRSLAYLWLCARVQGIVPLPRTPACQSPGGTRSRSMCCLPRLPALPVTCLGSVGQPAAIRRNKTPDMGYSTRHSRCGYRGTPWHVSHGVGIPCGQVPPRPSQGFKTGTLQTGRSTSKRLFLTGMGVRILPACAASASIRAGTASTDRHCPQPAKPRAGGRHLRANKSSTTRLRSEA